MISPAERSASAPTICARENLMAWSVGIQWNSIELRHADARVEVLQNLVVRQPGAREAVGADLTHADAVPPAAPREGELRDTAALVVRAVDDEELLAQTQRRAHAPAADVRRPGSPDDFEVEDAPRDAAPPHAQVEERSDLGDRAQIGRASCRERV